MIFKIIDLRSYAEAKQAYDEGQKETDVTKRPTGPAIDRVQEIEFEFQKARLAAMRAQAEGNT